MEKILLVAVGGAIGAVLRFLSVGWAGRVAGDLAWGTMAVNVVGSFLMGVLAVVLMERAGAWSRFAPFLITGLF